jgi:hypothetical protein
MNELKLYRRKSDFELIFFRRSSFAVWYVLSFSVSPIKSEEKSKSLEISVY